MQIAIQIQARELIPIQTYSVTHVEWACKTCKRNGVANLHCKFATPFLFVVNALGTFMNMVGQQLVAVPEYRQDETDDCVHFLDFV